ncbi:MAG TPA: PDZ domain-containing protein [Mycobacteriales bacterium]|nr:PDZ domain-containing protein [Mycobacteriales bacterium]
MPGYYRFPTVHDETMVFGSEDDLWTVPVAGGVARRLTANLAETSRPALSPDGTRLAFTSREEEHPEVWCMPSGGGPARRLTHLGHLTTTVVGWSPAGRIIAVSAAGQPFRRWTMPLSVDPDSGVGERLPIGPVRAMAFQPGGAGVVIARNSIDPARWKRYRGGTAGQLWVDRSGDGNFRRILANLTSDLASPMWVADRIYFLSDHEGIGNIYSVRPNGADLRRHTDHGTYYARFPSSDGRRIVYQHAADLWLLDPQADGPVRIDVETASPRVQRNRRFVPAEKQFTGFGVHPAGREVAIESRGQVVTMPLWEDAPHALAPRDGVRQRLGRWLADGETVVLIDDDGGEEGLVVHDASGVRRPETGDLGHVWELVPAPAGEPRVAIANNRAELIVVDVATGATTTLDRSDFGTLNDLAWSPDGRWLAYSCALSRTTRSIKLCDTSNGAVHAVTRAEFRDVAPAWHPAGRYLYFLSSRLFDPVPDEFFFDLNFPRTVKPMVVPLRAVDRSPFRERPHPMKPTAGEDQAAATDAAPPAVTIDLDGIDRRAVDVPVALGRYLKIGVTADALLLLSAPIEGSLDRDIFGDNPPSYTIERLAVPSGKQEPVATDVADFAVSADGSTLVYRSKRRLRALPTAGLPPKPAEPGGGGDAPSRESGWLDLERIRISVDPAAEWRQMFVEAWRLQREYFWNPEMSGVDWEQVRERYLPLVDRLGARSELSDLLWETQGELGTSHAYEIGGEYRPAPAYPLGFLGADFELEPRTGRWRIAHIVRADHWNPQFGSPLEAPGVDVKEGDTLLAVNGRPTGRDASPASLLVNLAGTAVELTVGDTRGRRARRVVVTTLRDEQPLRYREWVERNREAVHAATDGRVGYIHVPDMGTVGYAEFHRSYLAELPREALIVDVRDNSGGFVSGLLLEKLARKPIGAEVPRRGPVESYPAEAPDGPLVCLTNQNAGSDGDIFSHGFKLLGLGPLIGTRTWGGVVGIDGRHRLVDGGITTQPQYAFWFRDVGWGVENYGTDPDVVVDKKPQDWAAGRDPQLDKGLQLIQQALRRHKPKRPATTPRPKLPLPTLPKRPH